MKKTVLSAAIGDGRPDYRQSYVSGRAGNAGSYRVNTRTGRPDFAKNLFSPGGERMPMSVGLSFWQYAESGNYSTGLPSGWMFGFQQCVYASGSDISTEITDCTCSDRLATADITTPSIPAWCSTLRRDR